MSPNVVAPNVVLYGSGLFGRSVPAVNQQQLTAIQESGFTTVILWTLHIDSDGSLVYNDTVIVKDGVFAYTFYYLPELLAQLTSTGSVQKVLFCIGSGGTGDFKQIKTLLGTKEGKRSLIRNFSALSAALPIDGYDFDDEEYPYDVDTLAKLTELLCANNKMIITYCPFTSPDAWRSALQQVYSWDQQRNTPLGQSVQWWNLQCYSGGQGNDPLTWAKSIDSSKAGVSNAHAFIVPGYDANNQSPSMIQKAFAKYAGTGINGGFIWNSGAIFASQYTPQQYAQAIITGLGGTSTAAVAPTAPVRTRAL
jgi:hypothetical protein